MFWFIWTFTPTAVIYADCLRAETIEYIWLVRSVFPCFCCHSAFFYLCPTLLWASLQPVMWSLPWWTSLWAFLLIDLCCPHTAPVDARLSEPLDWSLRYLCPPRHPRSPTNFFVSSKLFNLPRHHFPVASVSSSLCSSLFRFWARFLFYTAALYINGPVRHLQPTLYNPLKCKCQ